MSQARPSGVTPHAMTSALDGPSHPRNQDGKRYEPGGRFREASSSSCSRPASSALASLSRAGRSTPSRSARFSRSPGRRRSSASPRTRPCEIYVDKINAAGGIAGKKIELVVYDDGGDANKARTFATRLIEDDKVVAMVGGSTTGTTMAMIPVFEEAKVPFISLGGAIEIIDPVRKFVFKTPHTDKMACEKIFEDLKAAQPHQDRNDLRHRRLRRIDAGAMRQGRAELRRSRSSADETYGPRDSDMTAQLTKIKNTAGIQAIVNPGFGQGPAHRDPQLRPARHDGDPASTRATASPRRASSSSRARAAEGVRLPAAALLVGDKLPDSDPQKKVVVGLQADLREHREAAGLDLRRPRL